MQLQPIKVEWPKDRLRRALNLVIDEQNFSRLRKQHMKKKLMKLCRRNAMEISGLDTEWLYRLCAASLMLRDYHWNAWEWRSKWAAQLATGPWVYPRWDGDRTKRLLVLAEQGIGDEIVFASCYNDLARDVDEAWIEVDPRLIPAFERSFPENLHFIDRFINIARRIVPRMSDYPEVRKELGIEAFIMTGNVPKLYRRSRADFPKHQNFLVADLSKVEAWSYWLDDIDQTIGCSWKGRQGNIPMLERGVSLQYGTEAHGNLIEPDFDLKWDIDGVLALIYALDKVVTTTNAVAHMAGALAVPTDCIKPAPIYATDDSDFNNRVQPWWPLDKCDWYPSITMYRSFQEWQAHQKT
jgi:hypothetical protein